MGMNRPSLQQAAEYMLSSDHSLDGFFVKDLSGTYVFVNPAMANLIEKPASEVVGKTDFDLYEEADAKFLSSQCSNALKGEMAVYEHTRVVNGKRKSLMEVLVAKKSFDREPTGIYGISRPLQETDRTPFRSADPEFPSPAMQRALSGCLVWAPRDVTILIMGETGSGKDYLARYIYDHSSRGQKPFMSINCAAISETLFDSELFGHKKGSFTGAVKNNPGLLAMANGGTLFLNEIGEVALYLQAKLLRAGCKTS